MNKICPLCNKSFLPDKRQSKTQQKKQRFCSQTCGRLSLRKRVEIKCLTCKNIFLALPYRVKNGNKYCSNKCRTVGQKGKPLLSLRTSVLIICANCGIEFLTWPSRIKAGIKYCSRKCMGIGGKGKPKLSMRKRVKKICLTCEKEFEITQGKAKKGLGKFCSKLCFDIFQTGKPSKGKTFKKGQIPYNKGKHGLYPKEKHSNWKGGITPLYAQIRGSFQYNKWRISIFLRDKLICQLCKANCKVDGNVDHYPKSFAQIITDNNVKTLEEALLCKELWDMKNGRTLCLACHKKTPTYMKPLSQHPVMRTDQGYQLTSEFVVSKSSL